MELGDSMKNNRSPYRFDILKNMQFNQEDFMMLEQIKGLYEFRHLYESGMKEICTKLSILDQEFNVKYDHNPIHHVESRFKDPQSIVNKLNYRGLEVSTQSAMDNLSDIAGVRVVCNYLSDIYFIERVLLQQDDIKLVKKMDYIQRPKQNGYRCLHLVVTIPVYLSEKKVDVMVEIQVRTIAMDFWASLEHELRYKQNVNDSHLDIQRRLRDVSEKINDLDHEMLEIYVDMKTLNGKDGKM